MFQIIQILKLFNHKWKIFFHTLLEYVEIYNDACLKGLAAVCGNDFYRAKVHIAYDAFFLKQLLLY